MGVLTWIAIGVGVIAAVLLIGLALAIWFVHRHVITPP